MAPVLSVQDPQREFWLLTHRMLPGHARPSRSVRVEALGTFGKLGVGKPAWGGALADLRHEFLHRLAFLFLTEPRGYADLNAAFDKPCAAGSGATSRANHIHIRGVSRHDNKY